MENDVIDKNNLIYAPEKILKKYYEVVDKISELLKNLKIGIDFDFSALISTQNEEKDLSSQLTGEYASIALSYKRSKLGELIPSKSIGINWNEVLKECYRPEQAPDRDNVAKAIAQEVARSEKTKMQGDPTIQPLGENDLALE